MSIRVAILSTIFGMSLATALPATKAGHSLGLSGIVAASFDYNNGFSILGVLELLFKYTWVNFTKLSVSKLVLVISFFRVSN